MASKTKTGEQFDDYGLPIGRAAFTVEQTSRILNVGPRALKRWRLCDPPKLKAIHPGGPKSPPLYTRAELIRFLSGK